MQWQCSTSSLLTQLNDLHEKTLSSGKVQREICFYVETSLYDFCVNSPWNVVLQLNFDSIQDGPFRGCSRKGGRKGSPSLKSVKHILQIWNLAVIPYLRKAQKIYESLDAPLEFCWHQHFFIGNQQIWYTRKYKYKLHFGI